MATGYKDDLDEKQAADERYNPSTSARDLYNQERDAIDGYDRKNDGLDDHPISGGDASGVSGDKGGDPGKNLNDIKEAEENPDNPMNYKQGGGGGKQPFNFRAFVKKKGPIAGIIALLGGGGIALTGLTAPAMLLMQITDIFTNNFNDAHTSLSVRTNVNIGHKINSTRNSFSETSDGKCGIRCKRTTMTEGMRLNLIANGYKVNTEPAPNNINRSKFNRHIINSITLPNGQIIRNGNEFKKAMRDPVNAAQFNKVFNSKTRYFLNTKFGSMLKTKLGINKAYKLVGDSKEKFRQSFRVAIGLPAIATPSSPNVTPTLEEMQKSPRSQIRNIANVVGKLGNKPSGVVEAGCFAYNTTRAVNASVKVAKYSAYAGFAMAFFNAAHKLKAADGGGIDPLVVSELGDMLTYTDPNKTNPDGSTNELYGLSATDSYGYKAAAYGDSGAMPEYAKNNSFESAALLEALVGMTFFATQTPEARLVAQQTCRVGGSDAATFVQCLPTAPTIVGYVLCVGGSFTIGWVIGNVVTAVLPHIIAEVINMNVGKLDEKTRGALAGDVLYPGMAAILGGHAASYGMKAGTKSEIKSYIALGNDVRQLDEAIARIEAKEAPFDIYNQYSFLGSMARNLNIASLSNTSLTQSASFITATIPRSIASLTTNSSAGTYMPVSENKANQYGNPECKALAAIGVHGDGYCAPGFVKSVAELNADITANETFMIEGGYISDETGEPRTDTAEGKEFQKYLDYCPFRVDAPGETSMPIESGDDGDYEWYNMANCQKDTVKKENDVFNFRVYAGDEPINAEIDGEKTILHASSGSTDVDTTTGGQETTNENSGNVVKDGWTFPTTPNAPLSSPFGQRGGGFHTGIDMGVPSGSPFYATRDGTVMTREYNVYSIADGLWCPVLGSMSDPNQKDIWITHDVNGTTYTSIYAHMSRYLKKTGDVVKAGDLIGYTGGSGCSSGPHVHFEIWQGRPTPGIAGPGMRDPWPLINP